MEETEKNHHNVRLSISWLDANISHVHSEMLERMWEKAEILLSSPGFLLATDRNNELSRLVASLSDQKNKFVPPHYVCAEQRKVGMEVKCNCPVYKSTPSICQHTLAAAQDMMILPQYITWVRKTKSLNLSQLIADSVPQSGWKKSTVRRKAAPRKQLEGIIQFHILSSHSHQLLCECQPHFNSPIHLLPYRRSLHLNWTLLLQFPN